MSDEIHKIARPGGELTLIGTAHVSRLSAELVEKTIRASRPDVVCLELDEARFNSIQNPNRWRETDLFQVVKSGRSYLLMVQLALASFQKRLAKEFGINAGEEMLRAIAAAREVGARIVLIDREIKLTLKRAWGKASLWSLTKLFFSALFSSFGTKESFSEEQLEALKEKDALSALLSEFSEALPELKEALVDERDLYMAAELSRVEGVNVVAVVGAGHIPGILKQLDQPIDQAHLRELPKPRLSLKLLSWSIPALILALFLYGFFSAGAAFSLNMMGRWVLITGSLAAVGSILALAHPLTVLVSFLSAPFTTLHPLLAAGWFAGLTEALIRKPRVSDMETITDDFDSIWGLWHNRVGRILLVVIFANLGSALGALVGLGKLASLIS